LAWRGFGRFSASLGRGGAVAVGVRVVVAGMEKDGWRSGL
jgi:hypothetical protein